MSWTLLQRGDHKTQTPLEAGEAPCEPVEEELRRLDVLHSLPFLLTADEPQCMQRVLPKVQQVLPNASAEFHLAASSTFLTILEKKLVHPRTFTQTFLQGILSSIDSRDSVVASAWLETLLDVIDLLSVAVIKSDILPVAIAKGQIAQPICARLTACKLLGKIATKFEPYTLKKEVLPLIHSLCQDVNYEVRACICSQLHYVARSLDAETVKPALLPSLVELASDEESHVRLEAVETIVNMLPNLQADSVKFTIVPLVKKMCEQSLRAEDSVMVKISEQFGKLCLGLEKLLTPQEKAWMLRHYQKMAELGLPQLIKSNVPDSTMMPDVVPANTDNHIACRHNCAYNFPAMTVFCCTAGKMDNFNQQLYSTFRDLACDPHFMIRHTIACGLYEIAGILGSASSVLKPEMMALLRDDVEVLQGLVPHLGQTLLLLSKAGTFSPDFMDNTVLNIGRTLIYCEEQISRTTNWRLHAVILGQLECLPHCIPSDFIYSRFIPIIFNRIYAARPVPCRMAAARTMLVFLRYNAKEMQKNAVRGRIDTDLCGSDSCYKRLLYVKMCATAMELFSRRYFKEYFFMPFIGLADDQVPNIRLTVVKMFPKLKAMLYLPGDHKLLTSLEAHIRNLSLNEKDRDVKSQLNLTIQALDVIEVQMEVIGSRSPVSKEDIEDQRKADEETKLSGIVSAVAKRKFAGQMDLKRRFIDFKSPPGPSVAEQKSYSSNLPRSDIVRTSVQHPKTFLGVVPRRSAMKSLEDEFYVDAGIRIPQQLTTSDFTPLPSRIPNVRDVLFKNKITSISTDSQNISQSVLQKEVKTEHKTSPELGNFNLDPKPNFSETHKVVAKTGNTSATSLNVTIKKTCIPSNVSKRNSGVFSGKVDCQAQQTSRGKPSSTNKQKLVGNVTATNRRHSYLEGDKVVKIKSSDITEEKKDSGLPENRRHSYLDRLQASSSNDGAEKCNDTFTVKKLNTRGQNVSEAKLSANRRHSYNPVVQNNRADTDVPFIKRGAASNRHSVGPETRKSAFNSQSQIKRGTSLDRETGTDATIIGSTVKRRSIITPSAVKHIVRRHSSLEIDDMDRLTVQGRVQVKRTENKFFSSSVQKELMCTSTDGKTVNKIIDISKTECSRSTQRELQSLDDIGPASKMPRGGGISCHSSPGNSRASSPTIVICGSSSKLRQRTAPNSRASSPTGADKLQQRLSLGSLNCYMSNLKLAEPGTSRLPVRNFSRPH